MAKQIKEWTNDDMDIIIPKALDAIMKLQNNNEIDERLQAILITAWVDGYCSAVEELQPEIDNNEVMEPEIDIIEPEYISEQVEVEQPEYGTTEMDATEYEVGQELYADTNDIVEAEVYTETDTTDADVQENAAGFNKWQ
jgi:hypothetical protein